MFKFLRQEKEKPRPRSQRQCSIGHIENFDESFILYLIEESLKWQLNSKNHALPQALAKMSRQIDDCGLGNNIDALSSKHKKWRDVFTNAVFPLAFNVGYRLGILESDGYLYYQDNFEFDKDRPVKVNKALDKAIINLSESNSALERLCYWLLHSEATDGRLPTAEFETFSYALDDLCTKLNFPHTGQVLRANSNVIYVWHAVGKVNSKEERLCKVGITNVNGGEERILKVAKSSGFTAEILIFQLVGESKARELEKRLLSMGRRPDTAEIGLVDGKTEFRYFSKSTLKSLQKVINESMF